MLRNDVAPRVARWRMAVAVLVATIGSVGLVASANPAGAEEIPASGELRLVGWFAPFGSVCTSPVGLDLEYDATGSSAELGVLTGEVSYCAVSNPSSPAGFDVVEGAFTLTTDRGGLTGEVTGVYAPNPHRVELTVTAGTGGLVGATGTLLFDGDNSWTSEGFVSNGTFTGTITVPDRPSSLDDCRDGGWRDLVDDTGAPFRNQGHCVSWVIHDT